MRYSLLSFVAAMALYAGQDYISIRIDEALRPFLPAEATRVPVWGISFSPDGRYLAIGCGNKQTESDLSSIAILDLSDRGQVRRHVRIQTPHWLITDSVPLLRWSPDGRWLVAGALPPWTVIDSETGSHHELTIPNTHRWDLVAPATLAVVQSSTPSRRYALHQIDLATGADEVRELTGADILAFERTEGLLASSGVADGRSQIVITTISSGAQHSKWIIPSEPSWTNIGGVVFADHGRLLCAAHLSIPPGEAAARGDPHRGVCWETATGDEYGLGRDIYSPLIAGGKRILFIRADSIVAFKFFQALDGAIPDWVFRRVVWDVRQGKQIRSDRLQRQQLRYMGRIRSIQAVADLSFDGSLLADAESNEVRIFQLH